MLPSTTSNLAGYCPKCAKYYPLDDCRRRMDGIDECEWCGTKIVFDNITDNELSKKYAEYLKTYRDRYDDSVDGLESISRFMIEYHSYNRFDLNSCKNRIRFEEDYDASEAAYAKRRMDVKKQMEAERHLAESRRRIEQMSSRAPWDTKYYSHPCPYCGSYKVRAAKWDDKGFSVAFWGVFSPKLHCRYKCDNCKKMWE